MHTAPNPPTHHHVVASPSPAKWGCQRRRSRLTERASSSNLECRCNALPVVRPGGYPIRHGVRTRNGDDVVVDGEFR
jgi:hypothetical protein